MPQCSCGRICSRERINSLRMFHIVVFEPEIPPNTGNLIRLAANTGCELHLIKPLGFRLDRKSVRRAGLDYDELATLRVHDDFAAARSALTGTWYAIETGAPRRHVDARFSAGDVLLFGSERRGLPPAVLEHIAPGKVLARCRCARAIAASTCPTRWRSSYTKPGGKPDSPAQLNSASGGGRISSRTTSPAGASHRAGDRCPRRWAGPASGDRDRTQHARGV